MNKYRPLTRREAQVVALRMLGLTEDQTAAALGIATRTAAAHYKMARGKLYIQPRRDPLVILAVRAARRLYELRADRPLPIIPELGPQITLPDIIDARAIEQFAGESFEPAGNEPAD